MQYRIGQGFDLHQFAEERDLILGGVKIGSNSIIGAGSVVTKDIPSNVIAAGNPAKVIRKITKEDKIQHK